MPKPDPDQQGNQCGSETLFELACNCNTLVKYNVHRADPWKDASRCLGGGGGKLRGSGQNLIAAHALQRNSVCILMF